ncbi:LAGLIDADG family homing endonuclease [Deinococcus roseus]|uniref:Homing endonuclease LAGLIDADG domain-containing protein n=1 Tax=Deinococcus roseus TaxID=392414 RepID=A0ABQ2D6M0_9DEIO|nr:LAGLIDADG family homing endonuclease [Deinococcus roseus]GGJ45308.1 hypothetical protein GCM10008938_34500 [Deinococcus roseus]
MKADLSLTEIEIAWLAGLLEGEGSFMEAPPSSPNSPRLVVSMTDLDVIEKVASLFGTRYIKNDRRNPERWKTCYVVKLSGTPAMQMMKLVHPHMGERRRKKIEEILEKYASVKPKYRLTELQAKEILSLKGTQPAREIAQQFPLHIKTVEQIWSGKRWPQLQQAANQTPSECLNHLIQSSTGSS